MSETSRYTSPLQAGARWVAQRLVMKPFIWSLATVTVLGRERLEGLSGPYVVVSNHASHLDAPLIIGALPPRLARYLAANAAADYFFDVWWRKPLTALFFNAFPVDRTGLRGRSSVATSLLDRGVPLLIFPEGGRSPSGELGTFKPGAAALCLSRGVPCLPVAVVGAAEAMPRGKNWPERGRPPVYVTFGAPLHAEGESVMEFSDRIAKEVRSLIDETTDHRERADRERAERTDRERTDREQRDR